MTDGSCPVCTDSMDDRGLDDNFHVYHCRECDIEVLRTITTDHGGFSMEDLNNAASFGSTNEK